MSAELNYDGKFWEMNAYEKQRRPHDIIADPSVEIAVTPRALTSELMCPICLDLLKNTMTTKGCLHRFCQDCIIRALRNGNKQCPTCRMKLVSKRSLRPDPKFDMLISTLFSKTAANSAAKDVQQSTNDEELEVILKPLKYLIQDVRVAKFKNRYIKLSKDATVNHLVAYLAQRFKMEFPQMVPLDETELDKLFTIYYAAGVAEYRPLELETCLQQLNQSKPNRDKPITLHYSYKVHNS